MTTAAAFKKLKERKVLVWFYFFTLRVSKNPDFFLIWNLLKLIISLNQIQNLKPDHNKSETYVNNSS